MSPAEIRNANPTHRSSVFSTPLVDPPPVAVPPLGTRVIWLVVLSPDSGLEGPSVSAGPPPPATGTSVPPLPGAPSPGFPPKVPVGVGMGTAVGPGVGVGTAVGAGVGTAVGPGVGVAVGLGVGVDVGAGVGLGDGAGAGGVMLLVRLVRQVTVAPPPFPEPLHWLTIMLRIDVVVDTESTVQRTR